MAREELTVAGIAFAVEAFEAMSPDVRIQNLVSDGTRVDTGATLMTVAGPARAMLGAERTALNFLQRLSGVASLTSQFVSAVQGTRVRILDTRKTTPGWRQFEKYAVGCGGGTNHRIGLFDMILIKDNHLATLATRGGKTGAIALAVRRARAAYPRLKVEVETDTLDQVRDAVAAGADIILLDNMSLSMLREAVKLVHGRALTEASGGVSLGTVRAIAETGVDYVSVGALTHSARAVDIALDFEA